MPRKPDGRTKLMTFRVSDEELALAHELGKWMNMTTSDALRQLVEKSVILLRAEQDKDYGRNDNNE